MPILAKYNPNVIENMARSAQLLGDAESTIRAQAVEDLQQTTIGSLQLPPAQRVLNIDALAKLPLYRQRQLLHYWLGQDEPLPPAKQLVDEVLRLSQRRDHDHQTELFWQGRKQSYTIRRYRQQLYRLSSEWLAWLRMPLDAQTQTRSDLAAFDPTVSPPAVAAHSADNHSVSISLRKSKHFTWQVQMQPHVLAEMLKTDTDNVEIKIVPLDRQQRVQIAGSSRPQSGKKLYQTLGVPIWLRESLIVLSVVFHNNNAKTERLTELPILLLSPFDSWILGQILDSNDFISLSENAAFAKYIHNHLSIDNC